MTATDHLPHDPSAEEAIICASMASDEAAEAAATLLTADDFFLPSNQLAFEAIQDLMTEGSGKCDVVRILHWLRSTGKLEAAGGVSYLGAIGDKLPDIIPANIQHYARIVRDHAMDRRLRRDMVTLQDESIPLEERVARVSERLGQVQASGPTARSITDVGAEHRLLAKTGQLERVFDLGLGAIGDLVSIRPGNVCIVAAGASAGKTALALQVVRGVAEKLPVLFASLEMPASDIFTRMLCAETGYHPDCAIDPTRLPEYERPKLEAARRRLDALKLHFLDKPPITVPQIANEARSIPGLGLIVVDYLQLLSPSTKSHRANREQEVASVSRAIKELAMTRRVPVLLLSQLSRAHKHDRRPPGLHDLRESGSIEQDADIVLMISGPSEKDLESLEAAVKAGNISASYAADKGSARKLYVRKNRMGRVGHCDARWDSIHQQFIKVRAEMT